jgi:hypothetical protein
MVEAERRQFMDVLYYGGDMYLNFQGDKFFVNVGGDVSNNVFNVEVYDEKAGPFDYDPIWETSAKSPEERRQNFLKAELFQGKNILEVFTEIVWTDE